MRVCIIPPLSAYGAFGAPKNFGPGAVVLNKGPATPGSGGGGAKLSTTLPVSESLISSYAALWTSSPPCDKHIASSIKDLIKRRQRVECRLAPNAHPHARISLVCARARTQTHTCGTYRATADSVLLFFSVGLADFPSRPSFLDLSDCLLYLQFVEVQAELIVLRHTSDAAAAASLLLRLLRRR